MTGAILRLASWIVPRARRADWLAEWRAELHYVARVDSAGAAGFTRGAFRDALWLRRHNPHPREPLLASPVRALAALAVIAAVAGICRPAPRTPWDVVAIRSHGRPVSLTYDEYRILEAHRPDGIEAVAYYRVSRNRAVATRSMDAVLRGRALPGASRGYSVVDDFGPGPGYVIARISTASGLPWWHIAIPSPRGGRELLDCVPLNPEQRAAAVLIIFGIGVLALPALTNFSLGASLKGHRARMFFAAKLALALSPTYFASQAIAALINPAMTAQALLIGFILVVRWAFQDQRRRCPICLRYLASPVSFGCLGHILLDWHGSELICPEGHGLLQVSASSANPYAPQHWVRL
jgi:hypothetical protein